MKINNLKPKSKFGRWEVIEYAGIAPNGHKQYLAINTKSKKAKVRRMDMLLKSKRVYKNRGNKKK